jgi:FtsZ-interacting cell division protein ZipA
MSLSNVMDVLNCISFKGSISKERDILLTTENFEKVSNYLSSQYQIETILIRDGQQIPKSNHSLVFYATIEETNDADETIPKENFYIMLYKKRIFYPTEELSDQQQVQEQQVQEQQVQQQTAQPQAQEQGAQQQTAQPRAQEQGAQEQGAPKESVKESLKETIKQKLKTTKLTIVVLKEFLRELDLKVSGNKSELESRLMEAVSGRRSYGSG